MPENPTETIYNHLNKSFWTKRKCSRCQSFFTLTDYQTKNYQLTFDQLLKALNNYLKVIVQLKHRICPLANGFNYQKEILYKHLKNVKKT